jgi:hypothetical protein
MVIQPNGEGIQMLSEPGRDLIGLTMSCRHVDDVVLVVHKQPLHPADDEWEKYVHWCKALLSKYGTLNVLVIAGDKPPTSKQRSVYNQEIPGDKLRIAVLVTARHVLLIVNIFGWFVRNIKGFDRHDLPAAARYLEIEVTPAIENAILELGGSAAGATA